MINRNTMFWREQETIQKKKETEREEEKKSQDNQWSSFKGKLSEVKKKKTKNRKSR